MNPSGRLLSNQHSVLLLVRGNSAEQVEIERLVQGTVQPSVVFPITEELLLRLVDGTGVEYIPGIFKGNMENYGKETNNNNNNNNVDGSGGQQQEENESVMEEDLRRTIEWVVTNSDGQIMDLINLLGGDQTEDETTLQQEENNNNNNERVVSTAWANQNSESRLYLPSGTLSAGMTYTFAATMTVRPVKV